jgi:acetylornithine aminotransferase
VLSLLQPPARAASVAPAQASAEDYKATIAADEAQYVLQTYARPADIVFTHGKGTVVVDATGKEYLDFAAGIAVNALGHSDEGWAAAVSSQAQKLAHTSNLFHTVPQVFSTSFSCTFKVSSLPATRLLRSLVVP